MIEPLLKTRPLPAGAAGQKPFVYLWSDVAAELRFNGQWRNDRAAVGLLVGHHYVDPEGDHYVEVEGFVANTHLPDASAFTRHLRQVWRESGELVRRTFGDASLVGWYASHPQPLPPGQGELVLHNTFFPLPWQVGLWLEPDAAPRGLRLGRGTFLSTPAGVLGSDAEAPVTP